MILHNWKQPSAIDDGNRKPASGIDPVKTWKLTSVIRRPIPEVQRMKTGSPLPPIPEASFLPTIWREPSEEPSEENQTLPQRDAKKTDAASENLFGDSAAPKHAAKNLKPSTAAINAKFDDGFWPIFPRHVGKLDARTAFSKAVHDGADADAIIAGAARYAAERAGQDEKFTAHPRTWLRAGRWMDEPIVPGAVQRATGNGGQKPSFGTAVYGDSRTDESPGLIPRPESGGDAQNNRLAGHRGEPLRNRACQNAQRADRPGG